MSDLEKSIMLIMEKTVNHWIDIFIHVNSKGENNVKENGLVAIVLSILALCLSGLSLYKGTASADLESKDLQYVMFVGTNDKDTYEPYGTPDEVKQKADEVLTKHFEGFTIQDANGVWTNEDGIVDHEYTIVILLSDTTAEKVHEAADDLIKAFNQSSILIKSQ